MRGAWNKGKKALGIAKSKLGELNPASRKIKHKEIGQVFNTIKEAATANNVKYRTLSSQLNRSSKVCKFSYYE
jgi:hypothetical protein